MKPNSVHSAIIIVRDITHLWQGCAPGTTDESIVFQDITPLNQLVLMMPGCKLHVMPLNSISKLW